MNTVQANGKFYIFEHPQNLIEVTESIYNEIKSMQQQYKSIVKTVDADNLPDGEVLALDYGKLYLGQLIADKNEIIFREDDDVISLITPDNNIKYIEQKDLLKLISGV